MSDPMADLTAHLRQLSRLIEQQIRLTSCMADALVGVTTALRRLADEAPSWHPWELN